MKVFFCCDEFIADLCSGHTVFQGLPPGNNPPGHQPVVYGTEPRFLSGGAIISYCPYCGSKLELTKGPAPPSLDE